MGLIRAPLSALAWIGRQGTLAAAAVLVIGIAVPPLGRVLKPYVTEAIFVLLCLAFSRVDLGEMLRHVRQPKLVLAATGWTTLVIPAIAGGLCLVVGVDRLSPDLMLALILQAVASPMMSAPAFAALMGLDVTLVLLTLVASTAIVPLTAAMFTYIFLDPSISFSPLDLAARLAALLAGAAVVAALIRRLAGLERIERYRHHIDGVNILALFVFGAAVMENVAASFIERPLVALGLLGLVIASFLVLLVVTRLVFARAGPNRAFALGFMASQRNMGLMLAATGGAIPELVWFYVALCQFPIFLSPHLLKPWARRVAAIPSSGTSKDENADDKTV